MTKRHLEKRTAFSVLMLPNERQVRQFNAKEGKEKQQKSFDAFRDQQSFCVQQLHHSH